MRILIHCTNYAPEPLGTGKYTGVMTEWLAANGHEIRVVTTPPYYPHWRVADGYSAWTYKREIINGVTIWRCPLWIPSGQTGFQRLMLLFSFVLSSLPVMCKQILWKPELVMVIEPSLVCAPMALLTAHICGARAWLHVQDFEVDAAFDLGLLPSWGLRTLALRVEKILMRCFDHVSTISQKMMERLYDKRVERGRCVFFPNWVETDVIYPLPTPGAMRAELGIAAESIVALYSGNMGEKQGLEVVLEAAEKLVERQDIQFVLCGAGASRKRLQQAYATSLNVIWLPLQPLERLNELLNIADIHLLPQRADAADLVMPSKLTGILSSGRPVVATVPPETQVAEVVQGCGIITPPGDVNAFAEAISKLACDLSMRTSLGTKARQYALRELDKETILNRFHEQLLTVES